MKQSDELQAQIMALANEDKEIQEIIDQKIKELGQMILDNEKAKMNS